MIFSEDHGISLGKHGGWIACDQGEGKCLEERFVHLRDSFTEKLSLCSNSGIIAVHPDGVCDFRKILFHCRSHRHGHSSECSVDASVFRMVDDVHSVQVFCVFVKPVV